MDAYVDLSFIFHLSILCTLPYYYKKIFNHKFKVFETILFFILSITLYFNVFLFPSFKYVNVIFIFLFFLLTYKKHPIKYFFTYMFVYYGNVALILLANEYAYLYNLQIFINDIRGLLFIPMLLVNILVIEIIMFTIKSIELYRNYRMKVKVRIGDNYIEMKGYLDSGNTLLINNLPVIFINEEYFTKDDKEMIVRGIGISRARYFKTSIEINKTKKDVICASSNKEFKGCECLLNIHLLEDKS